jgi:predicted DNA-binding transcriptional regulator AlpA
MKLIEILENRKEALKVAEVAKMLGVTPQHIYKMAKAGLIPCSMLEVQSVFAPQTFQNG